MSGFCHQHRVTYAECTVGNHIYHSRYLDILEEARGEYLRSLGHPVLMLQNAGYIFPVIEAHLAYLRPARYDDLLQVTILLGEVTPLRLQIHHRIHLPGGAVLLEAETRHVCTSVEEKPRRMPRDLYQALLAVRTAQGGAASSFPGAPVDRA